MSKAIYNSEQINELLKNKYVLNCTKKSILFKKIFKQKALKLDKKWFNPKDIFKKYLFPGFIVNSRIPTQSLKNWRNIAKNTWLPYKKRVKKTKKIFDTTNMSIEEENEYLRAEVAYLKEMYKFKNSNYP